MSVVRYCPIARYSGWLSNSVSSLSAVCMVLHQSTSPRCSHQFYRRSKPSSSPFGCSWWHRCTTNKYQDVRPKTFCCLRTSHPEQASASIRNTELSLNCFCRELMAFYFHRAYLYDVTWRALDGRQSWEWANIEFPGWTKLKDGCKISWTYVDQSVH